MSLLCETITYFNLESSWHTVSLNLLCISRKSKQLQRICLFCPDSWQICSLVAFYWNCLRGLCYLFGYLHLWTQKSCHCQRRFRSVPFTFYFCTIDIDPFKGLSRNFLNYLVPNFLREVNHMKLGKLCKNIYFLFDVPKNWWVWKPLSKNWLFEWVVQCE